MHAAEHVDLGPLRFERGGSLLIKQALRGLPPGAHLRVTGSGPDLAHHLQAWCRRRGHGWTSGGPSGEIGVIYVSKAHEQRWHGAETCGHPDAAREGAIADRPAHHWGLAARGARVEQGLPDFNFYLDDKTLVWAEEVPRLYAQACAAQWDPSTAVDWSASFDLPEPVEDAVVQVMTYLIENETVALLVPARFLSQIHPHFREVMQLLAIQAADEARHIEVFTRRATLKREYLGTSSAGGQASLKTLFDEPDFALAFFLLSVLGEGSFLSLLRFLQEHAPDPVTRRITRLAAVDEARHVAFGLAHLGRHVRMDPGMHARLAAAIRHRHDALRDTSGLNEEVFDALVLLAAGGWEPAAIKRGHALVEGLRDDMDRQRRLYLQRLGFSGEEAGELSALHTRNFM